jgi:tetratricopeptide (TPR) repeat protein
VARAAGPLAGVGRAFRGLDGATLDYLRRGPALVEIGDTSGYERFREEAIARFSARTTPFADRIVKISLLLPANPKLLGSLQPLAASMAKSFADANAAGDGFMSAWRAMSLALWEYRRGNFAAAIEWGDRCLGYRDYHNAPRTATVTVILALACQQLGDANRARAELERAKEMVEAKFQRRLDRGTPIQGFWFDWAFARILLREAEALIDIAGRVE